MRVLCVDDNRTDLEHAASLCGGLPYVDAVTCFSDSREALEWIQSNNVDVALLDVGMPTMDGMELAKKLRECRPNIELVFVTGHAERAVDAFALRASGYLIKPATIEGIHEELEYAMNRFKTIRIPRIAVHTFGTFDVKVYGNAMHFKRSKAKEILAYLVDMEGGGVTRAEIFAALWEDKSIYDRAMQKQVDVNLRSLKETLAEYGISEILEMKGGYVRIRPEYVECDLYRFMRGEPDAIKAYRGVYMNPYPWAEFTEAYMTRKEQNAKK